MDQSLIDTFSLDGQVAVVTGGASGIGRETSKVLSQAGARVIAADVQQDALNGLEEESQGKIIGRQVDVTDKKAVEDLADFASQEGAFSVWVNAAGIINTPTHVTDVEEATLDKVFAVNLKGTYWGCAAAAKIFRNNRKGSIINISSGGADLPAEGLSVYALSKSAVNMVTRTLATEMGSYGVRVNAVAPGFIDTPMVTYRFTNTDGSHDEAAKKTLFENRASGAALNRIGYPRDIALTILYLASEASAFTTGQVLRPNGGIVML